MPPAYIIEGRETSNFPQVVLVDVDGLGSEHQLCSGTLVAPDQVLTAAHCVTNVGGFDPTGYTVMVGENYYDWAADTYDVDSADYNFAFTNSCWTCGNDIAVLRLAEPVEGVTPMGLATREDDVAVGDRLVYVGFGKTDPDETLDPQRRQVTLPTVETTRQLLYAEDPEGVHSLCRGDSGGAALLVDESGYRLAGIISFVENEDCTGESASTRISGQVGWLDRQGVDYRSAATPASAVILKDAGCQCSGTGAPPQLSWATLGLVGWLRRRRRI